MMSEMATDSRRPFHQPRPRLHCCYCKRDLVPPQPERSNSVSWDHVKAESMGGVKKVPCCRKCNLLKDDLSPEDWFWFIGCHPRWWREFSLPSQVQRVVREFRYAQAQARKRQLERDRLRGRA